MKKNFEFNKRIFSQKNEKPKKVDLLLVTLPRRNPHIFYATQVPEALGRLKSCVEEEGFSSYCIDFDNYYFKKAIFRRDIFDELDEYFRDINDRKFFRAYEDKLSDAAWEFYNAYLDYCVEQVAQIEHEWLGVSVFTEQSARASIDFMEKIRKRLPKSKIVIGGYCMITAATHHSGHILAKGEKEQKLGEYIKSIGLCDYFVVGEGELALLELMRGNDQYPGINRYNPEQIKNLDELPLPDYTDFDFREYLFPNPNDLPNLLFPMISITGSRGCVRNCVFCDINTKWPSYRFVTPEVLSGEIIAYYERYGIKNFHWSDSLVNGSPRLMKRTLQGVVEYSKKNNIRFWQTGSFIIKEPQHMGEEYYQILKDSGFDVLIFGIESGSEECRKTMKKNFTNKAIDFTVEMCRKYEIECQFLLIVGYPTETEEDFRETLRLIYKYRPRFEGDRSVIWSLSSFGFEYDADETPLNRDPSIHRVSHDNVIGWTSPVCNNYLALKRTKALYKFLEDLGYPTYGEWKHENEVDLQFVENNMKKAGRDYELISDFYLDSELEHVAQIQS